MKLRPPPPFAPRPRDEQFLAVVTWQRIHLADEKLHEIFDTLDTEGLGYLTAETIQAALGVVAQRWQGGKRWQKTSTR